MGPEIVRLIRTCRMFPGFYTSPATASGEFIECRRSGMKNVLLVAFLFVFIVSLKAQTATVVTDNAKLRGTASESGKKITTLEIGAAVEIVKQSGAWCLVQAREYVGWIESNSVRIIGSSSADTISVEPPVAPAARVTRPEPKPIIVSTPPASAPSTGSRTYFRGSRGGCYYINSKGNKTYVDRGLCS